MNKLEWLNINLFLVGNMLLSSQPEELSVVFSISIFVQSSSRQCNLHAAIYFVDKLTGTGYFQVNACWHSRSFLIFLLKFQTFFFFFLNMYI